MPGYDATPAPSVWTFTGKRKYHLENTHTHTHKQTKVTAWPCLCVKNICSQESIYTVSLHRRFPLQLGDKWEQKKLKQLWSQRPLKFDLWTLEKPSSSHSKRVIINIPSSQWRDWMPTADSSILCEDTDVGLYTDSVHKCICSISIRTVHKAHQPPHKDC